MEKSPDAFRTISEVAEWLDTPAHVLRFWESRFTQVKPVKRAGGRRYYRPADMLLLGGIKKLLHEDGLTIRGVQKMLREQGVKTVSALSNPLSDSDVIDMPPAPMAEDVPIQPETDNVVPLSRSAEPEVKPARETPPAPTEVPAPPAESAPAEQPELALSPEPEPTPDPAPVAEPVPEPVAVPEPAPVQEQAPELAPLEPAAPAPLGVDLPKSDPEDGTLTGPPMPGITLREPRRRAALRKRNAAALVQIAARLNALKARMDRGG